MAYQQYGVPKTVTYENKSAFIDTTRPKVYLTQGMRGAGKSLFDEMIAEILYNAGWTVLDLLSARNLENLYWCINKDHRKEFHDKLKNNPKLKGTLHCNCHRRYPITILVPTYVKFDQRSIDNYNKRYWGKEEYIDDQLKRGNNSIKEWGITFPARFNGRLIEPRKPLIRNKIELVKVRSLTPPTVTGSTKGILTDEFTKIVVEARKERRIVCFNPMLFPNEFHRYKTLELIIRSLEKLMYTNFRPPTPETVAQLRGQHSPVPREKWTKREANWDKLCVLMREFGEVTANILKGENQSTLTKKALLQYIRQTRHFRISLIGDYQRPDDVFPSIREQADYFIIKKAPQKLLGVGWEWLFKDIEGKRKAIFTRYGFNAMSLNLADRKYPKIENLSKNYCYVIYTDNTYKLFKTPTPAFHHKEELEHFQNDTGIRWMEEPFNARLAKASVKAEETVMALAEKNDWEEKVYNMIVGEIGDNRPNWNSILTKLTQLKTSKVIDFPDSWTGKDAVRKWFSRKQKRKEKSNK